jgi:hypothetical protein
MANLHVARPSRTTGTEEQRIAKRALLTARIGPGGQGASYFHTTGSPKNCLQYVVLNMAL